MQCVTRYRVCTGEYVPLEFTFYPYYSDYSDYTSPNTGADSNRVKYKNGSPQWQWERTPNAGNSYGVRRVNFAGGLSSNGANCSYGVAPACNVI